MVIFHGRLKIDESQVPISFYFTEGTTRLLSSYVAGINEGMDFSVYCT